MRNIFKVIALGIGICLGCTACGTGVTMIALVSPSISHVSPQVVTAGTPTVTVTVQGSNFGTNAAVTVNGAAVPTTVVDSGTLAAQISGSPLAQPTVAQLQVRNTNGAQSNEVPLTVTNAPSTTSALSIGTPSVPSAQVGTAYNAVFSASGGTPSYSWAISSGNLPAGLTLSSGGVLSGTPTASGTSTFSITVSDASSPAQQNTVTLSISVLPATVTPVSLSITTGSLAAAKNGSAYSATLSASGGTPGYTWSIASGSLPAGLSLSSSGVISGTPSTSGSSTFTVAVTDSGSPAQTATMQESITISPAGLTIMSGSLAAGKDGSQYSATLSASGGTPGYTWSVTSGSLPAGLSLSSSGVISGTPSSAGSSTFTVGVSDSGSPVQTASVQETITITAAGLTITSGSLAAGKNGSQYSATLSASGGTPGYTWSVTSGSLPAGLSLSSSGVISGTPSTSGNSSFTVAVTDSGSPAQTATMQESISVSVAGLTITSGSLATGKNGSQYSATLSASGGTPGYTWSVTSGSLPAGLSLSSSGVISGTPSTSGSSTFTVAVADSGSPVQTASVQETITVTPPGLTITSGSLGAAKDGTQYTTVLSASGGTPSYTWSLSSGSLPEGLALSSSGVISGIPTAVGTSSFAVTVTDSESPVQTASAQESITVSTSALSITPSILSGGQVGTQYTASLTASGGTPGYSWSVTSGSLPAGLTMSSSGVISGMPTASGTSTFTVGVTDSSSPVETASLSVSIAVSDAQTGSGTTWYVRPDGGTRYSSNFTSGQCDGKADQSYAAAVAANGGTAGTNMHCAFNDVRFLWQDGSYYSYWQYSWIIAGGDTVIIRGSIADGVSYRIGWDSGSGYCANGAPCFGYPGDSADSGAPALPGGTAGHPTRILGGNYGACTAQSARTQLHGGWGVYAVLDLRGAANIDIECLDMTDFSGCGRIGQNPACGSGDDSASYGIRLNNAVNNATFTDLRLHGLSVAGSVGAVGDATTFTDVAWVGNAGAGWNADDGSGTTGSGNLLVQNFEISWNGCAEEYPLVDALPYNNCTDDNSINHGGIGMPGYGDGFGTTTVTGTVAWHIKFENGVVDNNTQDGIDALHASGAGSTTTADRILAYGNMGNQIKIGSDGGSTITNNVIFSNCNAMSNAIPGTPSTYNAMLSDFCRADDEAIIISMNDGSTSTVTGNTIYGFRDGTNINSWGDLGGIVCVGTCTTADSIVYADNVLVGFDPSNTGRFPGQYYLQDGVFSQDPFTNPGSVYTNNLKYQVSTACPDTGETNSICAAPQLNNVTWPAYGYVDVKPSSNSSNVVGAGISLPSMTQDYTGATRGNPPSIGAYE